MIARLKEETAEQNTMRETARAPVFRSTKYNAQLLQLVLATVQDKDLQIQKVNGLRYECMRQSQDYFL